MAASSERRRGRGGLDAWPGYVDALSTLLMVIIFVLLVFVLAQGFLSVALSSRDRALDRLNRQVAELGEMLALERGQAEELRTSLGRTSEELTAAAAARDTALRQLSLLREERDRLATERDAATSERDRLNARIADLELSGRGSGDRIAALERQLAEALARAESVGGDAARTARSLTQERTTREQAQRQLTDTAAALEAARRDLAAIRAEAERLNQTVRADRETIQARLADIAGLSDQVRALTALRDQLERQAEAALARAGEEERQRRAAEAARTEADRQRQAAEASAADQLRQRQAADAAASRATTAQAEAERRRQAAEASAADQDRRRREAEAASAAATSAQAEAERQRRIAEATAADQDRRRREAETAAAAAGNAQAEAERRRQAAEAAATAAANAQTEAERRRQAAEAAAAAAATAQTEAARRLAGAQALVADATNRATTAEQARQRAEAQAGEYARLSESARAQVALLTRQLDALRAEISRLAAALDAQEASGRDKDAQIASLGQRLNAALAARVEELQRYRSDFFGRLRSVLGDRADVRIVGDRFVFQSEVLFPVASADLSEAGQQQIRDLARVLLDISQRIPRDVAWILRIDGHADRNPIRSPRFASNWELSAARAIAVAQLLIAEGLPANRVAATAFGDTQPLDPGDTALAFARNRRIEFRLTDR